MNSLVPFVLALAFAATPAAAIAAPGQIALAGDVKLEKTVLENGQSRTELLEPKVVVPGDRLLFTTRYTNGGTVPAKNFVVTNPLPAAVTLSYDAAGGYSVSVDHGKTWGSLSTLKVTDAKAGVRAATASDVTHLRWTLQSIAPGFTGTVRYRAIVR
jgi:uncharacterized repeat protein (TIGR01451 family)